MSDRLMLAEPSNSLVLAVAANRRQLDDALSELGRVYSGRLTLAGRMSRSPWQWLLTAAACGVVLGALHRPSAA